MRKKLKVDWSLSSCCGEKKAQRSGIWICPKCERPSPSDFDRYRDREAPSIGMTVGSRRTPVLNDETDTEFSEPPFRWRT